MSGMSKELLLLVLQFLKEEGYAETMHRLESESGIYLNVNYIEELVINGEWKELERYLSGFILVENRYSSNILFEIRKQKYIESLARKDHANALNILNVELKGFLQHNDEVFKELAYLLTITDIRENVHYSKYTNDHTARILLFNEIKKLIEMNPDLREKSQYPTLMNSGLRLLVEQSINWQDRLCSQPKTNPVFTTLLEDHTCDPSNAVQGPAHVANQSSQPIAASRVQSTTNTSSLTYLPVSEGGLVSATHNVGATEPVLRRAKRLCVPEEIRNHCSSTVLRPNLRRRVNFHPCDDLPKNVITTINQGSDVKSMDFHPEYQTQLLVGTETGDISLWEVSRRLRIAHKSFSIWNVRACSLGFQASMGDHPVYVNRVKWSPDGLFIGVAYSKHIVHVFAYRAGHELKDHLEIEAHMGYVSDVAFAIRDQKVLLITCGEDKTIKVWDATTGARLQIFEGHNAPVYSILPHYKENYQYIISTAMNGKIRVWLYDHAYPKCEFDAPGSTCTRLAYSSDGLRLFSLGVSNDGVTFFVEWNHSDGYVKQSYNGVKGKHSPGCVHFDVSNRFLAVGDNFDIKFWDMDTKYYVTTTNADGGLPASPCIRFNKDGILLAASTADNCVKILGNADGCRLIRSIKSQSVARKAASGTVAKSSSSTACVASTSEAGASVGIQERRIPSPVVPAQNQESQNLSVARSRSVDDLLESSAVWRTKQITQPSQLRSSRLPDNLVHAPIVRILYANSGRSVLALASNALHKLWKWQISQQNTTGTATAIEAPQLWQPTSGIFMINDIGDINMDTVVPCLSISKNYSYVMSSSGGKVSLFYLATFKTMASFFDHPPTPTSLVFNPENNNIIAVGLADCSIQIYNVRLDQVLQKLVGHQKFVTGLAYATDKKILVSSGADAQICVWNTENWEKVVSKFLNIPFGRSNKPSAETRVYFNLDNTHLLVVHETQIAIYHPEKLDCLMLWVPQAASGSITDAVYSCDGESIFVSIEDGSVIILTSSPLRVTCRINYAAYMPTNHSEIRVCPNAIASHPCNPNQFALGLSDGGVYVVEPLESDKDWGSQTSENAVGPSETPFAEEP